MYTKLLQKGKSTVRIEPIYTESEAHLEHTK
jgi:hypothetical protein